MRIFLRNYQTGKYFKTHGTWTEFMVEAHEFPTSDSAIQVAHELRLQNIEMLVMSDDGRPMLGTKLDIQP